MLYARLNEKKASSISKQVTSNNKTCDTLCLTNMRQKIYDTFDVLKMNKNHATFCQSGSLIIFQKPTQLVRWPESLEMIRSRSPRAKRVETSMRKIFVISSKKNMKTQNFVFSLVLFFLLQIYDWKILILIVETDQNLAMTKGLKIEFLVKLSLYLFVFSWWSLVKLCVCVSVIAGV